MEPETWNMKQKNLPNNMGTARKIVHEMIVHSFAGS